MVSKVRIDLLEGLTRAFIDISLRLRATQGCIRGFDIRYAISHTLQLVYHFRKSNPGTVTMIDFWLIVL